MLGRQSISSSSQYQDTPYGVGFSSTLPVPLNVYQRLVLFHCLRMFIADLSPTEQASLLGLAALMIAADGLHLPEEEEMLSDALDEAGLLELPEALPDTVGALCDGVTEATSKVRIMLEIASFAHVDKDYAAAERELMRSIAEEWDIDRITTNRIEEWAEKRVWLAQEYAEVLHDVVSATQLP